MKGLALQLFDLIVKPGTSLQLVPVINVALLLLMVVLGALTYSKIATIHLVVMGLLALGLLASVNWYYKIIVSNITCHNLHCNYRVYYEYTRLISEESKKQRGEKSD
jgi:hypothetical protein